MSSWLDIVENATGIRAVYGADLPTLNSIELREVCFHQDGPMVILRFELAEYPASPPKKWRASKANAVAVKMWLLPVRNISFGDWGTMSVCDLSLEKTGDLIFARAIGEDVSLSFTAEFARVTEISAYINGSRES